MNRQTLRSLIQSWSLLTLLAVACAPGAACRHGETSPRANAGDLIIGVSPFLPEAEVPVVRSALFRMILEKAPSGSRITVFDAYHLSRITDFRIPPGEAFNRLKIRTKHLGRNLREIQKFLDALAASGTGDGDMDGRIRAPQFLDLVAGSRPEDLPPTTVVLLGGALYLDPRDGRFSMESGRYPTDGHLCVAREESVFGVADRRGQLKGTRVHYAYLGAPWINDLHEEPVRRFWSLFTAQQGGELVTFAADLPTVVDRMGEPAVHSPWSYELRCPEQPKPEMMTVRRPVIAGPDLWNAELSVSPPGQTRGPLKIGIRWSCLACDLDLYSRPAAGAAELFYRNPKTAEGVYFKDYLTSPTPVNALESIEYLEPVDLAKVAAAVNFYGGQSAGGISGEVRVQTVEGTYGGEFRIEAAEGNRGGESGNRAGSRHWTVLDIGALVGLEKDRRPAGQDERSEPALEEPPAAPSTKQQAFRDTGPARGVRILSPQDGSTIRAGEAPGPVPHPVDGDVYGFDQAEIRRFGLTVEVEILTNQSWPQGIAEVRENGTWRLPTAWFGSSRHIVRAVLKDGNGNEIHAHEISVTVVH